MGSLWNVGMTMEHMDQVVLIDDHRIIFEGVKGLLLGLNKDLGIHFYSTSAEFEANQGRHPPLNTMLVLDLNLGAAQNGLALAEAYVKLGYKCVMMSGDDRDSTILQAKRVGAIGFIPKSFYGAKLSLAFRHLFDGRPFYPRALEGADDLSPAGIKLTSQQGRVLGLASQGKTNKEIGEALEIAEPTVKAHMSAIMRMLGVRNRNAAIAVATGRAAGSNRDTSS